MKQFKQLSIFSFFLFIFSSTLFAQSGATINGKITYTADQTPLHGATIQIVQLKQTAQADENGVYKFTNIPAGRYTDFSQIGRVFRLN